MISMMFLVLFIIIALLEFASSIMILKSKHILHSIIFLSFIFLLNSIIFAMLNQPLLAVVQLFIMIGGISVFMFVGVATEGRNHALNNLYLFSVLWLILFLLMLLTLYPTSLTLNQTQAQPGLSSELIAYSISTQAYSFYLMFIVVFLVAVGASVILGKLRGV